MILLPRVTRSLLFSFSFGIFSIISLTVTIDIVLFGISTPIVFLPGIGAWILTSLAPKASAISLFILRILLTFVPAFTSISNCVTDGPTLAATTCASILKSWKTCSSIGTFVFILSVFSLLLFFWPLASNVIGG